MQPLLTTIFLLNLRIALGQDFGYPTVTSNGQKIADFIPDGWTLLDSAIGDLNNDKLDDSAFVLQHKDNITFIKVEDGANDTVTTQPRLLVIAFKDKRTKTLNLVEQSNSFILNHDNPTMDDPFQSIKIDNGVLKINFHLFYNTGSWFVTNSTYNFRYQNNLFVLIGASKNLFHRATHDYEDYNFDLLIKKWTLIKGNEDKGENKTVWHSLDLKELKTFKTFSKPYTWEIVKDVYL